MTTALFAVTLSVSTLSNAEVRKVLRRADANRAVLYAETWLRRSRLSGRYFMVWYDQWAVHQLDSEGREEVVALGKAKDTEDERLYSRNAKGSRSVRAETPGRSVIVSGASVLDMRSHGAKPGPHGHQSARKPRSIKPSRLSPRRAGIASMVEQAKRKLAGNE